MDLQTFCREVPKVELHVHFTGAVPLDTFFCGLAGYCQAIIGGAPGVQLSNAVDVVLGE